MKSSGYQISKFNLNSLQTAINSAITALNINSIKKRNRTFPPFIEIYKELLRNNCKNKIIVKAVCIRM